MEQILLVYSLPKETVTAVMILYKSMKIMVCSLDGDTDFFIIIIGVLQGDILVSFLFMMCLDYILPISIDLMKENGFTLKKSRSRWYRTKTITDTDYADDLVLFVNTLAQADSLLHSLEQVARGIGLYMNSDKTAFMCFNQDGVISILNDNSLKWSDNNANKWTLVHLKYSSLSICLQTLYTHKQDLVFNNLQRLMCLKNQPTNQPAILLN